LRQQVDESKPSEYAPAPNTSSDICQLEVRSPRSGKLWRHAP